MDFPVEIAFLSCMTSLPRFFLQKFYTKMKLPQLKRTFLCHKKNKYFSEADRHDNWDDSGQSGKPYLFLDHESSGQGKPAIKDAFKMENAKISQKAELHYLKSLFVCEVSFEIHWLNWQTLFLHTFSSI